MRPTLSRYQIYELDIYLDKNTSLLDIGGNVGFFSTYLSRFVKEVTILEKEKDFTKIGRKLIKKEKIKNVTINNTNFESHKTKQKYDFILSLAVHQYMKYSLDEYLKQLSIMLNKKGKVLLETHEREWENLPHKKTGGLKEKSFLKQ